MAKKDKKEIEIVKIDKKTRKKIVGEEIQKVEKAAQRAALKAMTELQLATQSNLSDEQKKAAKLIGSGYTFDETSTQLGKKRQEVVAWMAQPAFARLVNEVTIKEGSADKNERVRTSKRIVDELTSAMILKIADGSLENMPIGVLSDLLQKWSTRLDSLVDKKEEISGNKDLTVLILNHVQSQNGKKYDKLDDFLTDEQFSYPILDVEAEEVNDGTN
jgi:hypothetical protein